MKTESDKGIWHWFVEKVLPGLFIALTISMCGAAYGMWQSVSSLTSTVSQLEKRVTKIENNYVTQLDQLATMKRIEQAIQILLLQSGIRSKLKITD